MRTETEDRWHLDENPPYFGAYLDRIMAFVRAAFRLTGIVSQIILNILRERVWGEPDTRLNRGF